MSSPSVSLPLALGDDASPALQALRQRLLAVEQRIDQACLDSGRRRETVRLLPVSKTVDATVLRAAFELGYRWFGENRVQEAMTKAETLEDLAVSWCIIGHLQLNKAKYVVRFAHELHSLDDLRLAHELDRRLQKTGRQMRVLIQVNTSGEPQKSGLEPAAVGPFLRELAACDALLPQGFMTLALDSPDTRLVAACFRRLREVQDQARQSDPSGLAYPELSMGMSGDFPLAIAEGATIVRVGQAIFGARS